MLQPLLFLKRWSTREPNFSLQKVLSLGRKKRQQDRAIEAICLLSNGYEWVVAPSPLSNQSY
jgi:hypothetical protein